MIARVSVVAAVFALFFHSEVRAEPRTFVHVVRDGDTLASIARTYYGDHRREGVIVAENGLGAQGGSAIVVGLRLCIPSVSYYRVAAGESWAQLAERFYGEARRGFVLEQVNPRSTGASPDPGAEILVPYPVRHVAGQHETVNEIAELYFGSRSAAALLRRFNNIRGNRLQRGQILLVPLSDLVFSEEGKRLVEAAIGERIEGGEVRAEQQAIDTELDDLREDVRRGRFAEAVARGNRLLGVGELTGNQMVTVQRELGTAYVALEREDLASAAFRVALAHQPDLELDRVRTSPIVLRVFQRSQRPPPDAGTASPDAGASVPAPVP